jgi:hypothetical protein
LQKVLLINGQTVLDYLVTGLHKEEAGAGHHAGYPSYSEGRDLEDQDSKPAQANSSQDPISKKPITKKGWWSGSSGKRTCLANVRP